MFTLEERYQSKTKSKLYSTAALQIVAVNVLENHHPVSGKLYLEGVTHTTGRWHLLTSSVLFRLKRTYTSEPQRRGAAETAQAAQEIRVELCADQKQPRQYREASHASPSDV